MASSQERFVSEPIRLLTGDGVSGPEAFIWRGERFSVTRLLRRHHDFGSPMTVSKPSWRTRRHRNVFDVELEDGRKARIYLERGTKRSDKRVWVLERFLTGRT
jgi:hypothetical protein